MSNGGNDCSCEACEPWRYPELEAAWRAVVGVLPCGKRVYTIQRSLLYAGGVETAATLVKDADLAHLIVAVLNMRDKRDKGSP